VKEYVKTTIWNLASDQKRKCTKFIIIFAQGLRQSAQGLARERQTSGFD
jgi:hypothetical protein